MSAAAPLGEAPFRPKNFVLCAICLPLAIFMYVLDSTIANVALPNIAGNLGASAHQSTWVVTSFAISNAIALPLAGWLAKRVGEVKIFVISAGLFTFASVLCGLAPNMESLVACRALQGFVAGPIYPVTQSLMIAIFPDHKRAQAIVVITTTTFLAPIMGPILGGWLIDNYSWPWIFFINVPVGIFICVTIWKQMGHKPEVTQKLRIDYIGLITLAVAVGALQLVLDAGNDKDWFDSSFIIGMSLVAVISTAVFFIWERHEKNPIVDFSTFRYRNFSIATIAYTLTFGVFFSSGVLTPMWMQTYLGYTPFLAGLATAPAGIIPLVLTPFVGKYLPQANLRLMISIGMILMGVSFYMRSKFNLDVTFMQICYNQLILGLASVFMFVPLMTILLSDLKPSEIASGAGLAMFTRSIGGSFAVSGVNYLWHSRATLHHAQLSEEFTLANPNALQLITQWGSQQLELSLRKLDFMVNAQSYQISFNEIFLLFTVLIVGMAFIVWFTKPPFTAPKS